MWSEKMEPNEVCYSKLLAAQKAQERAIQIIKRCCITTNTKFYECSKMCSTTEIEVSKLYGKNR